MRISDWSSDVCSSDLRGVGMSGGFSDTNTLQQGRDLLDIVASLRTGEGMRALSPSGVLSTGADAATAVRSEERRVGKECVSTCRSRWSPSHSKKQAQQLNTRPKPQGCAALL